MKKGWDVKPFNEVLEIRNGRNQREVESKDGEFPIFGSAGNVMGYATSYICEAGTTIIGRKGNINTPIFSETKFWNVDTAFGLAAKPSLNEKFLFYYCLSFDFSLLNRGTTIPSLVKSELLRISIPLPPLPEQHRIVTLLDQAFDNIATAKANAQANLRNARALFESHLQGVFAQRGEKASLGSLVDAIATGPFGSLLHKSDYQVNGLPLVNPINIVNGEIIANQSKTISLATAKRLTNYLLNENDIVIGRRGEIGRCAVVTAAQHGWVCGTGCFIIRPSQKTDPHYLCHLLRSNNYRTQLESLSDRATMPSISNKDLAQLMVAMPPIAEQRKTLAHIDLLSAETQRLATIYQQKISALEALKKSLLHQAFSGLL